MTKLLFVCTGNTCRSPMAEAYATALAAEKKRDYDCASAGLSAFEGDGIAEHSLHLLAENGLAPKCDHPVRFTREMGQAADRIFVMGEEQLDFIRMRFPELAAKTTLLGDGIPDPYGRGLDVYRECFAAIQKAVDALIV